LSAGAQLPLDFDHRPALSGEDFLVAPGNAGAVAWLDRWPDWPGPLLAIHGPAGCGKTHLAQVFMAASGARAIGADALGGGAEPLHLLAGARACVLEDAEAFLGGDLEEALLHLYNTVQETGRHMVLTARRPPARWPVRLADLRSRLKAAAAVGIGPPDDPLITAVIVKLFADRQLRVDADVVSFMLTRMERSFETARTLVAAVDRAALAERRNITVPLVRGVMEEMHS